jgi:hypothetical protein
VFGIKTYIRHRCAKIGHRQVTVDSVITVDLRMVKKKFNLVEKQISLNKMPQDNSKTVLLEVTTWREGILLTDQIGSVQSVTTIIMLGIESAIEGLVIKRDQSWT